MFDSKIADDERRNFSDRLSTALRSSRQPTTPSAFAREFNLRADGVTVSVHGARKWLLGEAIPTQERIQIIAHWLNVNAAWLRFGDAENSQYIVKNLEEGKLTSEQIMLINDIISLPPAAQLILRDVVDSFLRHDGMQTERRMGKHS
jgi:transcriptional regulator with XRE-family HTH domain